MLQKQSLPINFAKGLDQKTDPWQVSPDKFLALQNSIFTKMGRLSKRNGFGLVSTLSDETVSSITTFQGNLTAIGDSLYAYNSNSSSFVNKGSFRPLSLNVLSLIKNNYPQTQCDSATAPNGAVCVAYTENQNGSSVYKYSVLDGTTGQVLIAPTVIVPTAGAVTGSPRVFVLGINFVIVFTVTITGAGHLQYIAIGYNSFTAGSAVNITSAYTQATTVAFDASVMNGSLYIAWNSSAAAGILIIRLSAVLVLSSSTNIDPSHVATIVSVANNGVTVYVSYYDVNTTSGYVVGVDQNLNPVFSVVQWISSGTVTALTSVAVTSGSATLYYETSNVYGYDSAIRSDYVSTRVCSNSGTLGSAVVLKRSVGLASKAFMVGDSQYVLTAYSSPYQPTYFLLDSSGNICSQLAYENGGGYLAKGLPSVSVSGTVASIAYLYKDFISSTNTGTTNVGQVANIYSQTGINQANFTIGGINTRSAEIGQTLNISGGFLWSYDGSSAFENGFFLYPDSVEAVWSATGGSIVAKPDGATNTNAYFYQVTYEWSDNQGNQYKSTPSIPVGVTTTGSGTSGSIALSIPTLRLSYKTSIKICVYRWSVAQQSYFQVTSVTAPTLNTPATDYITYTDTLADASIIGNSLLYTTGGVIENTAAPACSAVTLFDNRLWLINAENPNVLFYSKQVIQNTPVEMSTLFTVFISPTQSAKGSTGPIRAIAPMDDKLIIFKKDAIYYINGTGPDNTGANSQYSEPVFISSAVGSENPESIVLTPKGLMFQSDQGIWLLGRDLATSYVGNSVEDYTDVGTVTSSANVPATTQIRFTLNTGTTLMYDYFYEQWGTFSVPAISATIYQGYHTILNSYFTVLQETPGAYLDNASPVLMSLTTAWFNLAGLQGYERAIFFYLLGKYVTPHKLQVYIAYDYSSGPSQSTLITPTNFAGVYGGISPNPADGTDSSDPYGQDATFGGGTKVDDMARGDVEQWRVFMAKQKCQSFQVTIKEIYDASHHIAPGQGLLLSGINFIYSGKKSYRPIPAANSIGGGGNSL